MAKNVLILSGSPRKGGNSDPAREEMYVQFVIDLDSQP